MAPFSFLSVGSVLVKSLGLFSTGSTVRVLRCSCSAPTLKHFSTTDRAPPKRPLTAYMQYVKVQQPIAIKENPNIKVVDIIRKIAQQWRGLTPEQKREKKKVWNSGDAVEDTHYSLQHLPFEEAFSAAKEQYKAELQRYQAQLTPAQTAAIAEEKRQKMAKRKAIRKKRELNNLGKPKRPRTAFNIFMAEHFEEARGTTMPAKLKSLLDDWNGLHISQKQVYMHLAEDDKVRYKNEMKAWEEHMTELGREDLIRRKGNMLKKPAAIKGSKKKSQVKVLKAKVPAKKTAGKNKAARKSAKEVASKPTK